MLVQYAEFAVNILHEYLRCSSSLNGFSGSYTKLACYIRCFEGERITGNGSSAIK